MEAYMLNLNDLIQISSKDGLSELIGSRKDCSCSSVLVGYVDKPAQEVILIQQFRSPVDAVRQLPDFCKEFKLPARDIGVIYFADVSHDTLKCHNLENCYELQLSCYFDLEDKKTEED